MMPLPCPHHSYFSRKFWHEQFALKRKRKAWIKRLEKELERAYSKATTQKQFRAIARLAKLLEVELRK